MDQLTYNPLKSFASNVLMRQTLKGEIFYCKWPGFYYTLSLIVLRGK